MPTLETRRTPHRRRRLHRPGHQPGRSRQERLGPVRPHLRQRPRNQNRARPHLGTLGNRVQRRRGTPGRRAFDRQRRLGTRSNTTRAGSRGVPRTNRLTLAGASPTGRVVVVVFGRGSAGVRAKPANQNQPDPLRRMATPVGSPDHHHDDPNRRPHPRPDRRLAHGDTPATTLRVAQGNWRRGNARDQVIFHCSSIDLGPYQLR